MKYFLIRLFFGLILLMASSHSYGQFAEKLRSTRPGEAVSPFIPGRNVFQLESGFTYGRASAQGKDQPDIATLKNTTFLRRSEEHTSELQSRPHLVCPLLL